MNQKRVPVVGGSMGVGVLSDAITAELKKETNNTVVFDETHYRTVSSPFSVDTKIRKQPWYRQGQRW